MWVARAVGCYAAGGEALHGAAAPAPATPAAATPPGSDIPDMGGDVTAHDEVPPFEMAAVREGAVLFVRGEFT